MNTQNTSSYNKIISMAIPFADILQDGDLPVRSLGVYTHFNDIVFYAPSERMRTERVKERLHHAVRYKLMYRRWQEPQDQLSLAFLFNNI
jgi:hypothetical protein